MGMGLAVALAFVVAPAFLWVLIIVSVLLRGRARWCPTCGCKRILRSFRRPFDRIFPAFMPPYRCECCKRRFYAVASFDYTRKTAPSQNPIREFVVRPGITNPMDVSMSKDA